MHGHTHQPFSIDPAKSGAMRLAALASVVAALMMIAAKTVAWLGTGSVAMLASLLDSVADLGASLTNLLAVRIALIPPDSEHRFGHGKAEPLAGLAQAVLIAGSAVVIVVNAIERLREPVPLSAPATGVAVTVFAIVITAALLLIQRHAIKLSQSAAIRADALHYLSDFAGYFGLLLAFALEYFGFSGADPVIGIVIAAAVAVGAWNISVDSVNQLMDRELPESIQQQVFDIATAQPGVLGIHDVRTRQSGQHRMIQLHIDLDQSMTLAAAHEVADGVEIALMQAFPGADVITHQDPVTVAQPNQPQTATTPALAAKHEQQD